MDADIIENLVEPENRLALVLPLFSLNRLLNTFFRSGIHSVYSAEEVVSHTVFGVESSPATKEIASMKASQLFESGIWNHLARNMSMPPKPSKLGPQVLTLKHLEVGFVVFSCLLATAFAIFLVEYGSRQLMKLFRSCLAALIVRELLTVEKREKRLAVEVKVKRKRPKRVQKHEALRKLKTLPECLINWQKNSKTQGGKAPQAKKVVKKTGKILKKKKAVINKTNVAKKVQAWGMSSKQILKPVPFAQVSKIIVK
jgi:hypothetical protein